MFFLGKCYPRVTAKHSNLIVPFSFILVQSFVFDEYVCV